MNLITIDAKNRFDDCLVKKEYQILNKNEKSSVKHSLEVFEEKIDELKMHEFLAQGTLLY